MLSHCNQSKKKKFGVKGSTVAISKATHSRILNTPFTYMWSANLTVKEYNALSDSHARCFFETSPTRNCMKKLAQKLKNSQDSRCIEALESFNLMEIIHEGVIRKHQSVDNVKILPYCTGLRQVFQDKLEQFKEALQIKQDQNEKEHKEYLRQCYMNKEPDAPKIRIVRTLQPIKYQFLGRSQNSSFYIHPAKPHNQVRRTHEQSVLQKSIIAKAKNRNHQDLSLR